MDLGSWCHCFGNKMTSNSTSSLIGISEVDVEYVWLLLGGVLTSGSEGTKAQQESKGPQGLL